MSHQVLCEPSIVSSTKYCLCQCQVWSNKVSSINQVLCAHQARSLPLPHHIIILSSIRYYLPAVWSGCQECDCYKCTCQGPQHTCSWNFQARRGTCQKLQLRSWSAFREHLQGNWSWIEVGAWNWHNSIVCLIQHNTWTLFVEFVFQILNICNLSRSGGRDVWIGANWDPGD